MILVSPRLAISIFAAAVMAGPAPPPMPAAVPAPSAQAAGQASAAPPAVRGWLID